jgi:betaine-aldehyde dehydrogenase
LRSEHPVATYATSAEVVRMPELYVDGAWASAASGGRREIRCPADGSLVAEVDEAGAEDTAAAIEAAHRAFHAGGWPTTSGRERGDLLLRVADLLERDADDVARMESLDTGKRFVESQYDVADVVSVFRHYGRVAAEEAGRVVDTGNADVVSRVVHEPVGVCGLITPWNYPLLQLSWKVAPAIAAGNTMVIKPSEVTPLTSLILVRLLEEAGVPRGVVNILLGDGRSVGAPLTEHPAVDMVSFTGGLTTGQAIIRASAATVKRVAVELGGKNPNIVFADTDFETAVDYALTAVFLHSGQVCSGGARLIVQDEMHDDLVAEIGRRAERIRLGNGLDEGSETGPLVSAAHRAKIEDYVASAQAEGARLVAGGRRPEEPELQKGFFYRPTVFADVHREMRVVREETFGPILTVERFAGEEEAIALGNDTDYGLAGAVWTSDMGRAERVAGALRHGTVWINDYHPYIPGAEWGGFKRSGNGRELGPTGLAEYQEHKHVWHNTAPKPMRWFTN